MPTSSGTSYFAQSQRTDKLLNRRGSAERRTAPSYNSYTSSIGHSYSSSKGLSTKDRTSRMLNSTGADPLSHTFTTRIDLNNNSTRSTKPYKPSTYKDDYSSFPAASTTSSSYGSHYASKTLASGNTYTSPGSYITGSSRSSSVDSGQHSTRIRKSSLASQNYNDSCSSLDPDTAVASVRVCPYLC